MSNMNLHVKMPNISDETLREMAKFFMKTSIPRIIAAEKEKASNKAKVIVEAK